MQVTLLESTEAEESDEEVIFEPAPIQGPKVGLGLSFRIREG
jgi:hypothetical protein